MNASDPMSVSELYRYPVKGLAPQQLDQTKLTPGETIPFDRAWAIENGRGRFEPANPQTVPKINFLMLMRNERLAALDIEFNDKDQTLTLIRDGRSVVKGALATPLGKQLIEQFMGSFMEQDLRGAPHIVHAEGHSFSDVAEKCLHIVNLASVRALERALNKEVDPLRFRANIYIDTESPWAEFDWIGQQIDIGDARLEVYARTQRCAATNVDPHTAERDLAIPAALERTYGHQDFGVYAKVTKGGVIKTGDDVSVTA
jgi:uncharacterized protein YcbX